MIDVNEIKPKMQVRTNTAVDSPNSTRGMMIVAKHLTVRKSGKAGEVLWYVPGHGGDVWFVKHNGSDEIGAYCFNELDRV